MVPTSLPEGIPGGMVATNPSSPRVASRSMLGLLAASSGVLPPNSSQGQSAIPSPWMITYFMVFANYPPHLTLSQGSTGRKKDDDVFHFSLTLAPRFLSLPPAAGFLQ